MGTPLLDIKGLRVDFHVFEGRMKVLNRMNLTVAPGEKAGLVGEMGCGKTTAMKTVMGLLPMPPAKIAGGWIGFRGRNMLEMKKAALQTFRRKRISMIFEDPTAALNPVYTIGAQLRDAVKYAGVNGKDRSKQTLTQSAVRSLAEVSLPDPERVLKCYPIQLSGGMRQRVCIAMALLSAGDLLIADEPDTSLDVTIKDQILRLLDEMVRKRGTSIILISHTLGAVRKMTDRLHIMYAGTIVERGPTTAVLSAPQHPYARALIAATPRLTGGGIGEGIPGRIPSYVNPPAGCRFHPRCSHTMAVCRRESPPEITVGADHVAACHLFG